METCYEPGVVTENLRIVEEKIQNACKRSGRKREDVTLIAVSKTKPAAMIREAYDAGIRVFGENKVQELTEKYEELPSDIRWHMIGHLQRNKVKYIIDKAELIHSVDSLRLLETIDREAAKSRSQRRSFWRSIWQKRTQNSVSCRKMSWGLSIKFRSSKMSL